MRYIVCVSLPGFYIRHAPRADEAGPLAVVWDRKILDLDLELEARGLRVGMPLDTARSLVDRLYTWEWTETATRDPAEDWLWHLVPFSDFIQPLGHHAAAMDLSHHPQPGAILRDLEIALAEELNQPFKLGIGASIWLAELSLGAGLDRDWVENPSAILRPYRLDSTRLLSMAEVDRLQYLGCVSFADLQKIPYALLIKHFGRDAERIHAVAWGRWPESPQPAFPPHSHSVQVHYDPPCEDRQRIDEDLQRMAQELGEKLVELDLQSEELTLYLQPEEGPVLSFQRTFKKPIFNQRSALVAFRLITEPFLFQPILRLKYLLKRTNPSLRKQRRLCISETTKTRQQQLEAMIQRLNRGIGESQILKANEIVPPREQQIYQMWLKRLGHG